MIDTLFEIFYHCEDKELQKYSLVDKLFHHVLSLEQFWKNKIKMLSKKYNDVNVLELCDCKFHEETWFDYYFTLCSNFQNTNCNYMCGLIIFEGRDECFEVYDPRMDKYISISVFKIHDFQNNIYDMTLRCIFVKYYGRYDTFETIDFIRLKFDNIRKQIISGDFSPDSLYSPSLKYILSLTQ